MSAYYESDGALGNYLLFHYGTPAQICPLLPDAHAACAFPARCVSESLAKLPMPGRGRALDLGCSVGRGSFELARTFAEVVGLDFSARFVAAAQRMQDERAVTAHVPREGAAVDELRLELPADLPVKNVRFATGDACALPSDLGTFDLVLMANLIDRLPDPAKCLARLPDLVAPGGSVIITSPYTWLEQYTPREHWLSEQGATLAALQKHLAPAFQLHARYDLPFLIPEHRRIFYWGIAEVSLWRKG